MFQPACKAMRKTKACFVEKVALVDRLAMYYICDSGFACV